MSNYWNEKAEWRRRYAHEAMKHVMSNMMEQTPQQISKECFEIAEAMIKESERIEIEDQDRFLVDVKIG